MGTNCSLLLADLIVHAYVEAFCKGFSRIKVEN